MLDEDTAIKVPELVLATTIPFVTKKPPFIANEPVLTSSTKSTPVGGKVVVTDEELSLEQLEANPTIQSVSNAAAAPNPTLEKNSFLFLLIIFLLILFFSAN